MDLTIIKEKLHSLQYTSAVDFVKDIRLMLSNCRTYNQVKTNLLLSIVFSRYQTLTVEMNIAN